ncbi:MAG: hypothetical protein MZU97_12610 [Bacillus subtilis]|nr:hypothetical protein [Bacillus subtilis]
MGILYMWSVFQPHVVRHFGMGFPGRRPDLLPHALRLRGRDPGRGLPPGPPGDPARGHRGFRGILRGDPGNLLPGRGSQGSSTLHTALSRARGRASYTGAWCPASRGGTPAGKASPRA